MAINIKALLAASAGLIGLGLLLVSPSDVHHYVAEGALGLVTILSMMHIVPSREKLLKPEEMADLIERFLDRRLRYPYEWNGFIEHSQLDKALDRYRRQWLRARPHS